MKITQQPELNIGMIGHVDHGKTSLTKALTGVDTDTHSEEKKRGISIKLGYADTAFYKCSNHPEPECYSTSETCPICGAKTTLLRTISFVDTPGHETLMATMLSGAAMMEGALLLIAANEKCPQPQTKEHLLAIETIGIKNVIVIQNKIDIVSEERARESFNEIQSFLADTSIKDAPIIPVSANHHINIDVIIQMIQKYIPTNKRNENAPLKMYIARSFDVNKPGTLIDDLKGGVIGGSIIQGSVSVGDEIEIVPGIQNPNKKNEWTPLITKVVSIHSGNLSLQKARPGGLIGIETTLDPSLTKADGLIGNLMGSPGNLPPISTMITLKVNLMQRIVGSYQEKNIEMIKKDEGLMLAVGTSITKGMVSNVKGDMVTMNLKIPICVTKKERVAIGRKVEGKWRLIGYGVVESTK
ncbi:MAG: translation initiation factor IF-2 subunit gamma [Thermoplasmata archaeon]